MVSRWSPGGCLETLLSAAMGATPWSGDVWGALFASIGYTVVFAVIGIRWFRWVSH
jgi:ABC-2 type transport system permease protein